MTDTIETTLQQLANTTNGQLPEHRAKAVEYGLTQFQQIGHERDEARSENAMLRDEVAALRVQNDGLSSQLTEAQSMIRTAMMVRDQAVADRVKWEALFISIQAQLRAFAVPAEPLIKNNDA
jgi:hypothetical protein